jgi:membrane associated rhomboid family serine protease
MIFIWVSFLELYLSPLRSSFIFILTGIAGSLMSVAIKKGNEKTLGASSGIFGLFGAGLAYLLFNWKRMDHENSPRLKKYL